MATAGHTQRRNRISVGVLIDKWKHAAVVYVRYVPDDSEKTLNGVLGFILCCWNALAIVFAMLTKLKVAFLFPVLLFLSSLIALDETALNTSFPCVKRKLNNQQRNLIYVTFLFVYS